jgi:hypothetical protein
MEVLVEQSIHPLKLNMCVNTVSVRGYDVEKWKNG